MAARFAARLSRAANLTREDRRFIAIAVKELTLARLRHATTPIDVIFHDLRQRPYETVTAECAALSPTDLRRLSCAIAAAAARVPWRSDCVLQAMGAQRWMRCRLCGGDFFVSVRKDPQGALLSHAWLRRGDLIITGGADLEFEVLLAPLGTDPSVT
jgi:hypothetical protein